MSLVSYSSSSDSDLNETETSSHREQIKCIEENKSNSLKLPPAAKLLHKRKLSTCAEDYTDNPMFHEGRLRSFKHVRGNWATHVHIPITKIYFEDVRDCCLARLNALGDFKLLTDLHISLSKTVVLQYHMIESFIESLNAGLKLSESFHVTVNELMLYTNSERTRTFLALKIDKLYMEKMLKILKIVDQVMHNFGQSTFYEDPSFHISFLWCLGDKVDVINSHIPQLVTDLQELLTIHIKIQTICCKSGHKVFNFNLKEKHL